MVRRVVVALVLSLVAVLAARGTEVPLAPVTAGPATPTVIGAVPRGDGFLLHSRTYTGDRIRIWGTRISPAGDVDTHPILLASRSDDWGRTYAIRNENGATILELTRTIQVDATHTDQAVERLTIDVDAVAVMASEEHVRDYWLPYFPKNAKGETLAIAVANDSYLSTILFVGSDGVARKPTPLPEISSVDLKAVPVGDDWVILGQRNQGAVWYRISEAKRDTPMKLVMDEFPSLTFTRTIANAGADFAIAYEDITSPATGRYNRSLVLRTIDANGATSKFTLLSETSMALPKELAHAELAVVRDGNAWIVAYPYFNGIDTTELRMYRVSASGVEQQTRPVAFNSGSRRSLFQPFLVAGTTHNALLFLRPATFGDRVAATMHAYVWGRGSLIPSASEAGFVAAQAPYQSEASAVQGPNGTMSVWLDRSTEAYARFFAPGGEALEPVRLTSPLFAGRKPVVARNGETFAVAWLEWRLREYDYDRLRVLMLRFDANGVRLDDEPVVIFDRTSAANMPDTPGLAIGAETDGFRIAFHARSLEVLANHQTPAVSVFTTHVPARGSTFAEPTPVTPSYLRATEPMVISDGAESLVIWKQGAANPPEMLDVYAQRFVDGIARGGTLRLTRGSRLAAAAHGGELLLVFSEASPARFCTNAQRFAFNGTTLAAPVTLDCVDSYEFSVANPSAVWDNGSWWVSAVARQLTHVHQLNADGTPRQTWRFFSDDLPSEETRLVATGKNPSAVSIHVDPDENLVERAFLRTFPWPKGRAARH
jgi:hypothetical protein